MQPFALTVDEFLDHAAKRWRDREIVTADAGQAAACIGYTESRSRSSHLSVTLLRDLAACRPVTRAMDVLQKSPRG